MARGTPASPLVRLARPSEPAARRSGSNECGERARPGRFRRRIGDWFERPKTQIDCAIWLRKVFGPRPRTAGGTRGTPTFLESTASSRRRLNEIRDGLCDPTLCRKRKPDSLGGSWQQGDKAAGASQRRAPPVTVLTLLLIAAARTVHPGLRRSASDFRAAPR